MTPTECPKSHESLCVEARGRVHAPVAGEEHTVCASAGKRLIVCQILLHGAGRQLIEHPLHHRRGLVSSVLVARQPFRGASAQRHRDERDSAQSKARTRNQSPDLQEGSALSATHSAAGGSCAHRDIARMSTA